MKLISQTNPASTLPAFETLPAPLIVSARRYMVGTPNFIAIELDISDSGREGCVVATVTITAEPRDWDEATTVAVQEIRRIQRHGLTSGEGSGVSRRRGDRGDERTSGAVALRSFLREAHAESVAPQP